MQGLYIHGQRPKSKAAVKRHLAECEGAEGLSLEATSLFGDEYGGPVDDAPDGTYTFVGPDPYTRRNFYGTLIVAGTKVTVK